MNCLDVVDSSPFFDEEAPFYWQFGRGGTILLGKLGRRLTEIFFIYVQNYAGGWLECHFMFHAILREHVI